MVLVHTKMMVLIKLGILVVLLVGNGQLMITAVHKIMKMVMVDNVVGITMVLSIVVVM